MATALPPIHGDNSKMPSYAHEMRPPHTLEPIQKPKAKRDRVMLEKKLALRAQMPMLRKRDIAVYRNSYKHTMCLDMLTEGFHMSFCEVVGLIKQQMAKRERAGPESFLWTLPVLNDQHDKLDMMKLHLTHAETARRKGDFAEEYKSRYELARYFEGMGEDDTWLVDHFFNTCLEVGKQVENDGGKLEAEGNLNVGKCLQRNGVYYKAAEHFEVYHDLSSKHKEDWIIDEQSGSFYTYSCVHLYQIYTIIGNELEKDADPVNQELSLEYFTKALEKAKDSGDKKLEGEAAYRLGLAYQRINQLDTALTHLFNFYDSCQGDSNSEGIGRACDAIAKIYARQGNKEKSVEFLKRFVELTEKTGLEKEYCLACHNLGNVCNSVGNYDEATEFFSKAYNIARALGETESTNTNRVQYGIAMAHLFLGGFANHVVMADRPCMDRLVEWKSSRAAEFNKPIPDANEYAGHHAVIPPPPQPAEEEEKGEEKEEQEEERGEGDGGQTEATTEKEETNATSTTAS